MLRRWTNREARGGGAPEIREIRDPRRFILCSFKGATPCGFKTVTSGSRLGRDRRVEGCRVSTLVRRPASRREKQF